MAQNDPIVTTPTAPVDQAALDRALVKVAADNARALTDKEQTALDAQTALQTAVKGYVPFLYHGIEMYRINDAPDHTFHTEQDAQAYVTALRYQRNMSGGTSA